VCTAEEPRLKFRRHLFDKLVAELARAPVRIHRWTSRVDPGRALATVATSIRPPL